MSYVSLKFLLFVVVLLILYYLFPKKYRYLILLIGSLYFYFLFSNQYIIYILLSTLSIYIGNILIDKYPNKKKLILIITILLNIGVLLTLKYNNFISSLINPIINIFNVSIPYKKFIMPIGISYYTLDMISYITDRYHKKIPKENNILKLLLYFTYFPKIVEGPFLRYDKMQKELFNEEKFNYDNFKNSWLLISYGFIKKLIIADRIGEFADRVFTDNYGGIILVTGILLYTIQLYMDFSGCINIITGISQLFNVKLPNNFNRPFFSKSIQEFWRRWHITLGEWLKEYIFYPISLSKINMKLNLKIRNWKNKHLKNFILIAFPLFFVWFINGMWHGASLKFIVYGLYYYTLMMLGVLLKPLFDKIKINKNTKTYHLFEIIRTIIIVCFGMFIFRCDSFNQIGLLLSKLFQRENIDFFSLGLDLKNLILSVIFILIIFIIELITEYKKINIIELINKQKLPIRWTIYIVIIFAILIFGKYGRGYNAKSFIYGGF